MSEARRVDRNDDRLRLLLDRRTLLRTGAAAFAGLGLAGASLPARAIGRISTGEGEIVTISDGHLTLPAGFVFPSLTSEELARMLAVETGSAASITPDCTVTLLRRGDRLAIFDVGSGPNFMPTAGTLLENLAEAGIEPEAVTDVVFTHAHPDHLWGVVDDFDELVFANASYRIARAEWDFWSSPDALSQVPEDRQAFVVGAQNRFGRFEDRVELIEPGDEVLPGVEAVDTSGHTPGHLSYLVHGAEPLMIGGDALTNVAVSFARPRVPMGTDHDQEKAIETRLSLLDRLASDKIGLIGFHLPHPGIGAVERAGDAYRFVPT